MDMIVVCSQVLDLYVIAFFNFFADGVERVFDISSQECLAILYGKYDVIVGAIDAVVASFEHTDIVPYRCLVMQEPKVPAPSEAVPRGSEYRRHGVYINQTSDLREEDVPTTSLFP